VAEESRGTVVVALAVNLSIAVAKSAAGLLTMSSAMLSEAAHSWADTTNQVFLIFALKRAQRPADPTHPFGYGKERFFWSLLAAVGIFVTGALFSVYQGVTSLFGEHPTPDTREFVISYVVLAVAFVLESISLSKAVKQLRGEAAQNDRGFLEHVKRSNDPTVKTVASEDSAAVTGLVLAGVGLALHQVTGSPVPDAVASIAIGVLLAWIAYALGRDTKELLIGESVDTELRLDVIRALHGYEGVQGELEILTMQLGPDDALLAAKLDFDDDLDAGAVEVLCSRIERDLRGRAPSLSKVFLSAARGSHAEFDVAAGLRRLVDTPDTPEGRAAAVQSLNSGSWRSGR
jgi:cation diffusion facilitator family transporter